MDSILHIFNSELTSGQFSFLLLLVSFLGGVVASISPCNLSILPIVIGYVGGYGEKDNTKNFIQMLFFVLGLSLTMTVLGVLSGSLGLVLKSVLNSYWILFLASIFLIMGLNLLGVLDIYIPPVIKEMPKNTKNGFIIIPFLVGIFFGLASTPCATPILVSIIGLASVAKNIFLASVMLFLFSLGEGLIIILAASFTSFLKNLKAHSKITELITKISAVLLILSALIIYYYLIVLKHLH